MPATASPLELIVAAAAVIGFVTSLVNFLWSRERVLILERTGLNGILLVIRRGGQHDQMMLCLIWVCLVVIATISLVLPSSPPPPRPPDPLQRVSGLVLLAMLVLLEWMTIAIRLRPRKLRGLVAHVDT